VPAAGPPASPGTAGSEGHVPDRDRRNKEARDPCAYPRNLFKRKEYLPKLEEQLQDYVAAYRRRGALAYEVKGRVSNTQRVNRQAP
jgi:hypothetical protein